jgi:hypothetical protein
LHLVGLSILFTYIEMSTFRQDAQIFYFQKSVDWASMGEQQLTGHINTPTITNHKEVGS